MKLSRMAWMKLCGLLCCFVLSVFVNYVVAAPIDVTEPLKTESRLKLEEKAKLDQSAVKKRVGKEVSADVIAQLTFPSDSSAKMSASELRIIGNTLISTEELVSNIPMVFSTSVMPLLKADSSDLYDFRTVRAIIDSPGQARQISARTIRGVTQCILLQYNVEGYSGIYVEALQDGNKLKDDMLIIKITEAPVTTVSSSFFTPDNTIAEEGYLKQSYLDKWSPLKVGEVGKQKELEDFVGLLNLNPDRYVSARVAKGAETNTLAVDYAVYEANPWHWFVQVDNAGTDDRRYNPRLGLINTNLLGFDDKLTVYHQAPWEKDFEDRYSVYGSYDFPLWGPKLRLELFGGYSQYDIDGGAGIGFLGHGSMYGGKLKYNFLQADGWHFDVTTSLSHENSKVSSSIFNSVLGSEVDMNLWGVGMDVHKRTDMYNTSVSFNRFHNVGGSGQSRFWDGVAGARNGSKRDFAINVLTANHGQYLDTGKVQRLSGSVRYIVPDARLVPSKMTTFGGMYSVRGYKESGLVADGGILASVQYEYDLVKKDAIDGKSNSDPENAFEVKKLAPLVFFDYGRTSTESPVAGEIRNEELYSVGVGALLEIGKHFSGAVYYGFPLQETSTTDTDDGRLNLSLMMRW